MQRIYLVVGVPAVGKSWVCEQLTEEFHFVPHDDYIDSKGRGYVPALVAAAKRATLPILGEAPFSLSKPVEELQAYGAEVLLVFIFEDEDLLERRWEERGNVKESTREGHLSRQETYRERAEELSAFSGSSGEVLEHLRECARQ